MEINLDQTRIHSKALVIVKRVSLLKLYFYLQVVLQLRALRHQVPERVQPGENRIE
jgi:hypothetical protein